MSEQRLIDANALKTELEDWVVVINKPQFYKRDEAIHIIDSAPTIDAVQVVRCGVCTWNGDRMCLNPNGGLDEMAVLKDDDYCSYGEKKDKEDSP